VPPSQPRKPIGCTGAFRNTINAALGRAKDGEGRASAVEPIFGNMINTLHMKTLTKPLAKMPAGAMFPGRSRKPDSADQATYSRLMTDLAESLDTLKDFPPVPTKAWEASIHVDLKGEDYNKKLVWNSAEGIEVRPYYRPLLKIAETI
jgi:hypothetical protein